MVSRLNQANYRREILDRVRAYTTQGANNVTEQHQYPASIHVNL